MNTKDMNRKNALKILNWCKSEYGRSFYKFEYPRLRVYKERNLGWKGDYDYDSNIINVFVSTHNSFTDFVSTIIHEYVHYTQSVRMYFRYIDRYNKTYDNHPYEKQADDISKRDAKKCIKEVFLNKNK